MLGNYHYEHQFRNLISSFGSLFNQIMIYNESTKKLHHVPIRYMSADMALMMKKKGGKFDNNSLKEKFIVTWPKMTFKMGDFTIDKSLGKKNSRGCVNENGDSIETPINMMIPFELNVIARNKNDSFQILEQIIPFFKRTVNLSIPSLVDGGRTNFRIIMQDSISKDDSYESRDKSRVVIYTLSFDVKFKLFDRVYSKKEISIGKILESGDPRPINTCYKEMAENDSNRIETINVNVFDNDHGFSDYKDLIETIEIDVLNKDISDKKDIIVKVVIDRSPSITVIEKD